MFVMKVHEKFVQMHAKEPAEGPLNMGDDDDDDNGRERPM
jgi:hypothetical protein